MPETPLKNDRLLRAARGETVDRVPVWLMRQAGRYLPEYRAARAGQTFFETCRDPDMVARVTLQPLERFPLDAAIIFSDILVVPQAMGMEVDMVKGVGPHFPEPLRTVEDLRRIRTDGAADELHYVYEGLRVTRKALDGRVPLIGFAGAPWTLMAYMVEGQGSKTFAKAKAWLYREPAAAHRLLEQLTLVLEDYLVAQIEAGAQLVQIFDSWAGLLGPDLYEEFGVRYLRILAEALARRTPDTPRTVFAKGANHALEALAATPFHVISIDWTIDPVEARNRVGDHVTLQGNMDPSALYADPDEIVRMAQDMVERFGKERYIANLGHGLYPDHDPDHVAVFVDAIHNA